MFDVEDGQFSMKEYNHFVQSIQPEIEIFRKKQSEGIANTEQREAMLLKEWEEEKARNAKSDDSNASGASGRATNEPFIPSSMTATCFKVKVKVGDVLEDADQVVVILEAMKTEVGVTVTDEFVGKKVKDILVAPGASVNAGEPLITLEDP